ncbi:hypothetical protein SEA_MARKY_54 [Streptomyces phage Marky]|nr:hypothetical protein SEA_MARKY_54 [Streptomyces phage Marky]
MPKINAVVREARAVLEGDCAGPPAGPRYRRHVEEQVAAVRAEKPAPAPIRHPHDPADHISFINADGTRSRICICVCDDCWPPGQKTPEACPDWS